jgi:hypothetical protein
MKTRLLKDEYTNEGIAWKITKRTEGVFFAERAIAGPSFEVGFIKIGKPHPMYENVEKYDLVETLPKNEDFGKIAWAFTSKTEAEMCFNTLHEMYIDKQKRKADSE